MHFGTPSGDAIHTMLKLRIDFACPCLALLGWIRGALEILRYRSSYPCVDHGARHPNFHGYQLYRFISSPFVSPYQLFESIRGQPSLTWNQR